MEDEQILVICPYCENHTVSIAICFNEQDQPYGVFLGNDCTCRLNGGNQSSLEEKAVERYLDAKEVTNGGK